MSAATPRTPAPGSWFGATNDIWADDTNWTNPFPVTGNTATFDGAGNTNVVIDLGAGVTVGNVIFDTASTAAYTLGKGGVGSQSLTLDNSGAVSLKSSVVTNQTINAALTLGNDGTAQTFTLTNASATTLSGIIGNGTTGSVALTKRGAGTLLTLEYGEYFHRRREHRSGGRHGDSDDV